MTRFGSLIVAVRSRRASQMAQADAVLRVESDKMLEKFGVVAREGIVEKR